jgi:hypothetical protein
MESNVNAVHREPWNKGKIVGQKAPFKVKDISALRVRLHMESRVRELALFNLGIDSKLRGCNLVSLKVRDVCHGNQVASRAVVMQRKTQRPVQFEITQVTRDSVQKWIKQAELTSEDFLFPSRIHDSPHRGTRQYARILESWVGELGLDPADYGTHSMRRTKALSRTTASASIQPCSARLASNSASPRSSRGPTGPKPMARPNASSSRRFANGPTAESTQTQSSAVPHSRCGFTSTTGTASITASASFHPHLVTRSLETTS